MTDNRVEQIKKDWQENLRWVGVERPYSAEEVVKLKGSLDIEHTLAKRGSEKLWKLINEEDYINALGALTGNQAVQQVKAGLKAIYLSGWQSQLMRTYRVKCIQTKACIQQTVCRMS